jgi:hypothetical protein
LVSWIHQVRSGKHAFRFPAVHAASMRVYCVLNARRRLTASVTAVLSLAVSGEQTKPCRRAPTREIRSLLRTDLRVLGDSRLDLFAQQLRF